MTCKVEHLIMKSKRKRKNGFVFRIGNCSLCMIMDTQFWDNAWLCKSQNRNSLRSTLIYGLQHSYYEVRVFVSHTHVLATIPVFRHMHYTCVCARVQSCYQLDQIQKCLWLSEIMLPSMSMRASLRGLAKGGRLVLSIVCIDHRLRALMEWRGGQEQHSLCFRQS